MESERGETSTGVIERIRRKVFPERPLSVKGLRTYLPENPDWPYYPDLGPVPEVFPDKVRKIEKVDLRALPAGSLVEISGAAGSLYTIQIYDTPQNGRYFRLWRYGFEELSRPAERKRAQNQGLFVRLIDFAASNSSLSHKGMIFKEGDRVIMPYFYEGEGPKGRIRIPTRAEDSIILTQVGRIRVQEAKKDRER